MQATGPNTIGYSAKQTASNTKLMVSVNAQNKRTAQTKVDKSAKNTIQRTQMSFSNIEKKMYRQNGGLMSLGFSVGFQLDQKG